MTPTQLSASVGSSEPSVGEGYGEGEYKWMDGCESGRIGLKEGGE